MNTDDRASVLDAVMAGDVEELRVLLERCGPDVVRADQDPEELTALHVASAEGHDKVVAFLLSAPVFADVSAARINNFTPLHSAAMNGQVSVCKTLLDAGADPNIQTAPQGYAPLHSAAWGGHVETIRTLLQYGASHDLRNYRNERPVETAERQQHKSALAEFASVGSHFVKPWCRFW